MYTKSKERGPAMTNSTHKMNSKRCQSLHGDQNILFPVMGWSLVLFISAQIFGPAIIRVIGA